MKFHHPFLFTFLMLFLMLMTYPIFATVAGNIPVGEYGKEVRVYNELKGGQATNYLSEEIALEFLNKLLREPGPIKEVIDTHKAKICEVLLIVGNSMFLLISVRLLIIGVAGSVGHNLSRHSYLVRCWHWPLYLSPHGIGYRPRC